jgi:acyl-CoA thioester hydrolase
MKPAIYCYAHTVGDDEIDELGHVSNLAYLKWMLAAAVEHSAAQGWPAQRYLEIGAGWVVRSHFIEYLQPAFAGQQVLVKTWVADFRKIRSLRKYKIMRPSDDALLAVAETDWAFVGLERRSPRRIPQELVNAFQLPAEGEEL